MGSLRTLNRLKSLDDTFQPILEELSNEEKQEVDITMKCYGRFSTSIYYFDNGINLTIPIICNYGFSRGYNVRIQCMLYVVNIEFTGVLNGKS
jgi:hypothetical protein